MTKTKRRAGEEQAPRSVASLRKFRERFVKHFGKDPIAAIAKDLKRAGLLQNGQDPIEQLAKGLKGL